jgi:phage terminase large subunit-like protein
MLEWACTDDDDLNDPAVVKLANPASGVTIQSLEDALEAPGITPAQFARYRANVWSQADDAVIAESVWDALADGSQIPAGVPRWVVVDYARKSDSCAVVQMYLDPDREKVVPEAHVWAVKEKRAGRAQPAAHTLLDGPTIRQSLVRAHIREIGAPGQVLGVIYDPHLFDPEELSDEGYTMVEFPQSNVRTVPASKRLYEAVNQDRFAHNGDPVLRSHVISAGTKVVGEGWRFFKASSKKRIDACICLMMGVEKALDTPPGGGFEW